MMTDISIFNGYEEQLRGRLCVDEIMAAHTSWKIGGAADIYYIPYDRDDLCRFLQILPTTIAVLFIGRGSNLLVRDGGIRGAVVQIVNCLDDIRLDGSKVWAECGVPCAKLARFCAMAGLSGLEFVSGIPGTVGGALAMNAGAYGSATWEYVSAVELLDRQGSIHEYDAVNFKVGYRKVEIAPEKWFLSATMSTQPDDPVVCRGRIKSLLKRRSVEQPVADYSCGSVFRNPDGYKAAELIDKCGLRGFRHGNACVSRKHANFIVHDGDASAADVEGLMEHVMHVVYDATGVDLQPEVRIVGEAATGAVL